MREPGLIDHRRPKREIKMDNTDKPSTRTAQDRRRNLVSDLTRRIKRRSTYLRVNRWRLRNPERQRALSAVARALQDFNLDKKPCERCGTTRNVCADPISVKPLRVVWRCRCCANVRRRERKTETAK
jgi:hypothetical protein